MPKVDSATVWSLGVWLGFLAVVFGYHVPPWAYWQSRLSASDWASWVQAIGSILTLGAGFVLLWLQRRQADSSELRREQRQELAQAMRVLVGVNEVKVAFIPARILIEQRAFERLQSPSSVISDIGRTIDRLQSLLDMQTIVSRPFLIAWRTLHEARRAQAAIKWYSRVDPSTLPKSAERRAAAALSEIEAFEVSLAELSDTIVQADEALSSG